VRKPKPTLKTQLASQITELCVGTSSLVAAKTEVLSL